jgi:acyl-CoA thioesterase-1
VKVTKWLSGACAVSALVACTAAPAATPDLSVATSDAAVTPPPSAVSLDLPRVVFLGDSLTAGYGLETDEAYPALLQARMQVEGYDYEVVNAGVSGDTSAGGLRRLDWALAGDVRVIVVALGGNDGLRGLPVEALKKNMQDIITGSHARGVDVLIAGMEAPPNFGPVYTAAFRQVYRDLAQEYKVVFVPFLLEGVAGIPDLNIRDGIHPNTQGARIVEATVWQALAPMLSPTPR